jgi:chromate transporter
MKSPSISGTDHETPINRAPGIRELVGYFLRLGTLGFGGPVALCGLMEKELVHDRGGLLSRR